MARDGNLTRVGAGRMDAGVEGCPGAAKGLQAQGGDLVGQGHQALQPGDCEVAQGSDELGAVNEGQAFLGLQHHRREAGLLQGRPAGLRPLGSPGEALAYQQQGHVGQRGQVAAGTHTALAGDHGRDVPIQALGQQMDGLGADATVPLQQAIDAGRHEGPGLVLGQGIAHARRVAAHQVQLQLLQLIGGDHHRGELTEAGVDAIDRAAFGDDAVHHGPVLRDLPEGRLVQGDALAGRDAGQQGRGEGLAVQADHAGSLRGRVKASSRAKTMMTEAPT